MNGIKRIPVQQPKQPFRDEIGGLPQLCWTIWPRCRLKLEPCISGHLHLSPHAEQFSLLHALDPPEIDGVAHTHIIWEIDVPDVIPPHLSSDPMRRAGARGYSHTTIRLDRPGSRRRSRPPQAKPRRCALAVQRACHHARSYLHSSPPGGHRHGSSPARRSILSRSPPCALGESGLNGCAIVERMNGREETSSA